MWPSRQTIEAKYTKVGDEMTRQINATFGRQLPLFPEWNAAQDRLEGGFVDDEEPSP